MRSTFIITASLVCLGLSASSLAQSSQPNIKPANPGTDTTGPSGNPARGPDSTLPTDTRPMQPDYDTRYPREPRVLPTPNNRPLPDPRVAPQPESGQPEQSGI